jgi:uncharacterized protein YdaU (DUF1376 family)
MKRYTTEEQIIKDIDKCHAKASALSKEAEQLDIIADELFKYPEAVEDAKLKRGDASRMRLTANNLLNKKAKKLGEKLSEFRTAVIPGVTDDVSVSQKLR